MDLPQRPVVQTSAADPSGEVVETINAQLPEDTWDQVPADGSINFDHYLYGAPIKG